MRPLLRIELLSSVRATSFLGIGSERTPFVSLFVWKDHVTAASPCLVLPFNSTPKFDRRETQHEFI